MGRKAARGVPEDAEGREEHYDRREGNEADQARHGVGTPETVRIE